MEKRRFSRRREGNYRLCLVEPIKMFIVIQGARSGPSAPSHSAIFSERLRLSLNFLLLLLLKHFSSPDFKVLSFRLISIKFGIKVHLVILHAKKDFFS